MVLHMYFIDEHIRCTEKYLTDLQYVHKKFFDVQKEIASKILLNRIKKTESTNDSVFYKHLFVCARDKYA